MSPVDCLHQAPTPLETPEQQTQAVPGGEFDREGTWSWIVLGPCTLALSAKVSLGELQVQRRHSAGVTRLLSAGGSRR